MVPRIRESVILPKIILLYTVEGFLSTIYTQRKNAKTEYQKRNALLDVAVIELLPAIGMCILDLCSLQCENVNLYDETILIYGKGDKERQIPICNRNVIHVLEVDQNEFSVEVKNCSHFFENQDVNAMSDQTVRRMINKYTVLTTIELHITPPMFRHMFATCLLEADVDIQEMLGTVLSD